MSGAPPAAEPPPRSGCCGGESVVVELEQVVGGRDQSPYAAAGGSSAALEAFGRAVELDLAEHGLDRDLALAVEVMAGRCGEHVAHERVHAAGPARPLAPAQAGIWWDEYRDAFAGELLHLALVPVTGVGEHDVWIAKTECGELALRGPDHRF